MLFIQVSAQVRTLVVLHCCRGWAGCLSGAELKSRTAKKSVKLIVSVLRCSHSLLLLARSLGDHGMAIPISSRRSIAPGRSMSLSCGAAAAAWPVRVTDDCDTKPAKVLNCLYSAAAAAAIDEWVSIYPSCPPARLPAAGRGARLKVQSCNKF